MDIDMRLPRLTTRQAVILLIAISLLTHFAWFGTPPSAVFDEVHFGKFLSAYFTGDYYFDIHPPLGKLVFAGWGRLWGFEPGFSFANIGDAYPDRLYLALRFLPTLAGSLLPLVIFGLALQLGMRRTPALAAGILVALDNALIVQSRFILLDSFLLLFGFGALWAYLRWRGGGTTWLLPAAGILGALAASIKWTGLTFLALIVILELIHLWKDRNGTAFRRLHVVFASFVVIPILVYALPFALHFALLPDSGPGDAFMTRGFQATLEGNANADDPALERPGFIGKFIELNVEMYRSNARLTATHPYSSPWYTWPVMARPIYYWAGPNMERIYLLGNPAVWWASTFALIAALGTVFACGIRRMDPVLRLLLAGWGLNLLPFVGIGRVMFLYHYFIALIFAILLLAALADRLPRPRRPLAALMVISLVVFVFFAPLTYGLPLSGSQYNARAWFSSWK